MSGKACHIRGLITEAAINWRLGAGSLEEIERAVDAYFSLPSQVLDISSHAIERFRTRTKYKYNKQIAREKIKEMLDRAREVELKQAWRVIQLINHSFKDARYFLDNQWMLVVCEHTVVTVYKKEANRWK